MFILHCVLASQEIYIQKLMFVTYYNCKDSYSVIAKYKETSASGMPLIRLDQNLKEIVIEYHTHFITYNAYEKYVAMLFLQTLKKDINNMVRT